MVSSSLIERGLPRPSADPQRGPSASSSHPLCQKVDNTPRGLDSVPKVALGFSPNNLGRKFGEENAGRPGTLLGFKGWKNGSHTYPTGLRRFQGLFNPIL